MAAEASQPEGAPGPTTQVVEFLLDGERFAVGVGDVDSIVELEGTTRVPRTSEAVDGVMDLRGEITAILNPRVYLEADAGEAPADQHVLVLDQSLDKQKLGLRVDQVLGVQEYAEDLVTDPRTFEELDTVGIQRQVIGDVVRRPAEDSEFEPVAWLDVEEIIRQSRQDTRGLAGPDHDRESA